MKNTFSRTFPTYYTETISRISYMVLEPMFFEYKQFCPGYVCLPILRPLKHARAVGTRW